MANWPSTGGASVTPLGNVASQAAMLALASARKGDWCIRTDISTRYDFTGTDPSILGHWTAMPGGVPPDGTITNTKQANMPALTIKSNLTGGSAPPADNTPDQLVAALAAIRRSSGAPSGGTDGDVAVRTDGLLAGALMLRTAGVWGFIGVSATMAQLLGGTYPAATYPGVIVPVSDYGNQLMRSDGTNWKWIAPATLISITADSSPGTNNTTAFDALHSWVPPQGLFIPGSQLYVQARFARTAGAINYTPKIFYGATDLTPSASTGSNTYYRGSAHADCRTANQLRFEGGAAAWLESLGTSTALTTATIDGSTSLQFGCSYSSADSTTTVVLEMLHVWMAHPGA
jgi:hypothetical protein